MTVVETLLVFVAIPAAIYGVIALLTLRDRGTRAPRYRPGQAWDYPPVWWTANPAGAGHVGSATTAPAGKPRGTAKGGARGSW
ncbi:hypothetical protein [Actinophytocola sp.]|uniref:aa3-type cytochrome oxidase subunit CtaJ n=1 Tax=Actinophytocola sp. TaxID=1872138 RepID=UPI002D7E2139|nr:hypothetical protein [Actinophytocola sp.]HET9141778.1 hypothetical protein [Actinophytocola sp.]HEU5111002.1 hypothetical protein [Micromonosporaceae bacterium]